MRTILKRDKLWDIVCPEEVTLEVDLSAPNAIVLPSIQEKRQSVWEHHPTVKDNVTPYIAVFTNPERAWKPLMNLYESRNNTKILLLTS